MELRAMKTKLQKLEERQTETFKQNKTLKCLQLKSSFSTLLAKLGLATCQALPAINQQRSD